MTARVSVFLLWNPARAHALTQVERCRARLLDVTMVELATRRPTLARALARAESQPTIPLRRRVTRGPVPL